ncbi:MAG: 16S rRNA (adenine(1518)-N(6)/adenine(1519)-N(6))-dimethyltransferase RsmA [Deinococcales bacterium]|nr:16S rRNA (adenine(1518)-N(6)/adenine(1519)-N(6))-dimethyltransferase RsmA [Deinococcales bacterium]
MSDPGPRKPLTARSRVAELLERHGLRADKGFGQNFLVDEAALRAIVDAAELAPGDRVLEVGPGLGVLSHALAERGAHVTSVELDRRLLPVLAETLADLERLPGAGSVEVVEGDAMRFDLARLPQGAKLVANLPYNVATAIVARALESGRFSRLVFLVQREVADRLTAKPEEPAYGALSLLVARFGRARTVRLVPPGAFFPPPKVTSAVVRVDVDPAAEPDPELFALIHQGFAHRRKTLKRNLLYAGYPAERVDAALAELGLDPRVRAEALDLTTFERLRERLR